jgi:hypothetical protein
MKEICRELQLMQRTFHFGLTDIPYTLLHSNRTDSLRISVEFEYGVEVIAPAGMKQARIEAILKKKATWILDKLRLIEEVVVRPPTREWVSGEKVPLLGQGYTLVIEERPGRQSFAVWSGKYLTVTVPPNLAAWQRHEQVRQTVQASLRAKAEDYLPGRVRDFAERFNFHPTRIESTELDKRWGSCTAAGAIRLNWRLILARPAIIDYVVVHELCHLQIGDHSPAFWNLLHSILPDCDTRREWLRINGPALTL